MRHLWPLGFLALLSGSAALANRTNVTIDDNFGDPKTSLQLTYLPVGAWNYGPSCTNCTAHPDAKNTYLGTWHVGMFNGSGGHDAPLLFVSVPFYGCAIYVYCILSNTENSSTHSDMTFSIDSLPMGTFTSSPLSNTFQYNALVFVNESLALDNHTLVIQNGQLGGSNSLMMLDYIVYSYDDNVTQLNATNPSSTNNASLSIIGGVLGSIIAVLLILIAFLCRHRRSARTSSAQFAPTSATLTAGQIFSRHLRRPRLLRSKTPGDLSFNPDLLVRETANRDQARNCGSPPVVSHPTQHPESLHSFANTTGLTTTAAPPTTLTPPSSPEQAHIIVQWQKRTLLEAAPVQPYHDVADGVAFHTNDEHYPDSPHTSDSVPPPPPRRMHQRFTVMNN